MPASEKWPLGKKGVPTYSMENKIHSTMSSDSLNGEWPCTDNSDHLCSEKKPTPLASGCPNPHSAPVPSKTPSAPPHHHDTPPPESPSPSPKIPAAPMVPSDTVASCSKHKTPCHPFPQPALPLPDSNEYKRVSPNKHFQAPPRSPCIFHQKDAPTAGAAY